MLDNSLVIYLISAAAALFIGLVLLIGWLKAKSNARKYSYEEQLAELTGENAFAETKPGLWTRWNKYWNKLFGNLNMVRRRGGLEIIIIALIVGAILSVFLKNIFSGFGVAVILVAVAAFFLGNTSNKKDIVISKQLPGFIYALKANVEAHNTPEQAFLNIVEDVPEPLYDEIIMVKQGLMASRSFSDSLEDMKETTSSKDLKFLASCLIQATESGGDIKEQLIIIQNILVRQQEVNDEINKGYRTASPVLKVATVLIPGSLIAMIILDESARDFWFKEPMSWILFMIIVVLYVISIVYTRNQVEKLRKF